MNCVFSKLFVACEKAKYLFCISTILHYIHNICGKNTCGNGHGGQRTYSMKQILL